MGEEYKTLHPIKFYRDYLSHNIRPDGREFNSFRPIILNVGSISTCDGSAIAKIGRTSVICGIKAELCRPKPETPNQGFLVPNLELSPLCSAKFKSGPPSEQAQVLSQLLATIVENSQCISLEELGIFPDKLAWCLYADLICLDYSGSVIDAALLALVGALKSVKLPTVSYDAVLQNPQVNLEHYNSLNVLSIPISTTFAIFDEKIILTDPTEEEEELCTGTVTVVLKGEEMCYLHKPGGSPLSDVDLFNCIEISKERLKSVNNLIESVVKSAV